MAWPTELRLNASRDALTVAFDDGASFALAAEYLRVESPSAEVRGHGPGQKVIITGADDVKIDRLEPIGNYAVRIIFDDGHDTGLYSWDYLHKLGRERERIWGDYLKARAAL
jgi:DUF971 family protein